MYIAIKIPQQLKFSLADEQQMFDKFEKKRGDMQDYTQNRRHV